MSCEQAIAGVVAVLCHIALLFGFRVENLARPLPMSDDPIEVSLIAGELAPAPPAPEAEPAPPPPAPVPEPIPAPQPKSESPPEPMAKLEPAPPPHREPPKPQRPAAVPSRKAAPVANATGAATESASAGGNGAGVARGSSSARPRFNPTPPYPPEARRARKEGRVLLNVAVSADGRAASVLIARSSGVASLDESALATVRRWTFEPARVAGTAVASRVEVPVLFKLSD